MAEKLPGQLSADDLQIDLRSGYAFYNGKPIKIQKRPLEILSIIHKASPKIAFIPEIFKAVWGSEGANDNLLHRHITMLRTVLKPHGLYVANRFSVGYWIQSAQIIEREEPPNSPGSNAADPRILKAYAPNNLPRLQPFFGRSEQLKQIKIALNPSSSIWGVIIDGPGGIGKTSLAVQAAYCSQPDQFRQVIFLSVKDREMGDDGEQKRTGLILPGSLEMFNELARCLGCLDFERIPEEQRIRHLHEALSSAGVLLILDNLESLTKEEIDEILLFVRYLPRGCKAILTSRDRIGLDSERLFLDKLDAGTALEIIADLAKHNSFLRRTTQAERLALYNETGGNPLLLRWIVGQTGRGTCREVTSALSLLRSCPPRNNPLEFIFGHLVQELTEHETVVLCTLAHFGLAARVEHLSEVTALKGEVVETVLHSLANRPLVVPDQDEAAYVLVPMVADFLRKTRPEDVAEAGNRLQRCAAMLIMENGGNKYIRFPVIDAAWPIVAAALPLFIAGSNEQLQTICHAIYAFLNFTGRWDELRSLNEQAEAKAQEIADGDNAGWRAYHAGLLHHRRGEADSVLTCGTRAALHWKDAPATSYRPGLVAHLRGLGYRLKENYTTAISSYHEALRHAHGIPAASRDVAIFLADLADAELRSGDPGAAERDLGEALRIIGSSDEQVTAGCNIRLGRLLLERGDGPKAETLAHEALSLSERIGRQEFIADSCHNLAKSLVLQGAAPKAKHHAKRAVELYSRLHSPRAESARETLRQCEE